MGAQAASSNVWWLMWRLYPLGTMNIRAKKFVFRSFHLGQSGRSTTTPKIKSKQPLSCVSWVFFCRSSVQGKATQEQSERRDHNNNNTTLISVVTARWPSACSPPSASSCVDTLRTCRAAGCFDAARHSSLMLHQESGTSCSELPRGGRFLQRAESTAPLQLSMSGLAAALRKEARNLIRPGPGLRITVEVQELEGGQQLHWWHTAARAGEVRRCCSHTHTEDVL